ncbi:hypothetical protein PR048_008176 [Dryococelus australis]|uniref:Uncharacterized protein n=1 Tax=Dryococelus australis TaxID=614101 RepID=A0ABQ9HX61_9NEOP|nr:hypothetical protein PR048_008176 [Dryococelus australis]
MTRSRHMPDDLSLSCALTRSCLGSEDVITRYTRSHFCIALGQKTLYTKDVHCHQWAAGFLLPACRKLTTCRQQTVGKPLVAKQLLATCGPLAHKYVACMSPKVAMLGPFVFITPGPAMGRVWLVSSATSGPSVVPGACQLLADSRENPPTNGVVQHDSHMRKSVVTRPGIELGSPWWLASWLTAKPPWPHIHIESSHLSTILNSEPHSAVYSSAPTTVTGSDGRPYVDDCLDTVLCYVVVSCSDGDRIRRFVSRYGISCQFIASHELLAALILRYRGLGVDAADDDTDDQLLSPDKLHSLVHSMAHPVAQLKMQNLRPLFCTDNLQEDDAVDKEHDDPFYDGPAEADSKRGKRGLSARRRSREGRAREEIKEGSTLGNDSDPVRRLWSPPSPRPFNTPAIPPLGIYIYPPASATQSR